MTAHAAAARAHPRLVHSLGVAAHRIRTERWHRDQEKVWRRVEPWTTIFTNLCPWQVISVVDGRDSTARKTWLRARRRWWRHRARVVAVDRSAALRSAVPGRLLKGRVSVDHFHLELSPAEWCTSWWPCRS
ncbi:transposase [Arsenicicoccus piscis]|uniref:transposase n=1 Tax=Arsenicicoccus piscis TaxID=673954 RepID=UPI003B9817C6